MENYSPITLKIDTIIIGTTAKDIKTLLSEAYTLAGETLPDILDEGFNELNYVRIQFDDSVRLMNGGTPTATTGEQYYSTDFYEAVGEIEYFKVISATGGNVNASITIGTLT